MIFAINFPVLVFLKKSSHLLRNKCFYCVLKIYEAVLMFVSSFAHFDYLLFGQQQQQKQN